MTLKPIKSLAVSGDKNIEYYLYCVPTSRFDKYMLTITRMDKKNNSEYVTTSFFYGVKEFPSEENVNEIIKNLKDAIISHIVCISWYYYNQNVNFLF